MSALPILISGGFTCGNRGDWALAESALQNLRRARFESYPLLQLFVPREDCPIAEEAPKVVTMARYAQRKHILMSLGVRNLYYRAQRRDVRRHLQCCKRIFHEECGDMPPILWFVGGGYMNDTVAHGRFSAQLGLLAQELGYRTIVTGQTIGPILHQPLQSLAPRFFAACEFLSVRDPDSLAYLAGVPGLRATPLHALDDVMYMEPITITRDEIRRQIRHDYAIELPAEWIFFTIHPQRSTHIKPDLSAIEQTVHAVNEMGHYAAFVNMAGHPEPFDDRLRAIMRASAGRGCYIEGSVTVPQLRALAAHATLAVSTRFHGLVFAFQAGTPGICLYAGSYYRTKSYRLSEQWGLTDWTIDLAEGWSALPTVTLDALGNLQRMTARLKQCRPPGVGELNPVIEFLARQTIAS